MDETDEEVPVKNIPELDWLAWTVIYDRNDYFPPRHRTATAIVWCEKFCDHCDDDLDEFEKGRLYGEINERYLRADTISIDIGGQLIDYDEYDGDYVGHAVQRRIAEDAAQRDIEKALEERVDDREALSFTRWDDLKDQWEDLAVSSTIDDLVEDVYEATEGMDEEAFAFTEPADIWIDT